MKYLFATLLLLFSIPTNAANDDVAARSISLFYAIKDFCPEFFIINKTVVERWQNAMLEIGKEVEGKSLQQKLVNEIERRASEVETTGPKQWCGYQIGHMQRFDVNIFLSARAFEGVAPPALRFSEWPPQTGLISELMSTNKFALGFRFDNEDATTLKLRSNPLYSLDRYTEYLLFNSDPIETIKCQMPLLVRC
jgi:hypothetical protein